MVLREVVEELATADHDLRSMLRRCQHACEILGRPEAEWFRRELMGYTQDADLPAARKVRGRLTWREKGSVYDIARGVVEQTMYGLPTELGDAPTNLDVYAGLDWILQVADQGLAELTGAESTYESARRRRTIPVEQIRVFPADSFKGLVQTIDSQAFDWASKVLAELEYAEILDDIWSEHRQAVERALDPLGLGGQLRTIEQGLQSREPSGWRTAALACRNLVQDVARHVWRDSRPTYVLLPGDGDQGKLAVTDDRPLNRMSAYLHQQECRGKTGAFLRSEVERLDASFRKLNALQSGAKMDISLEDARTVAIYTFLLLGELALRTDMQPILAYADPGSL